MKWFRNHNVVAFFVNFLAVVLGIAITFIGEGMISRKGEEKRAGEILSLIRDELTADMEGLGQFREVSKGQAEAIEYLFSHRKDYKSVPEDSLVTYGRLAITPQYIVMDNIASGLMSSDDFQNGIKDNDLKLAISEGYVDLTSVKESYNMHSKGLDELIDQAKTEKFKQVVSRKDSLDREAVEALLFSPEGLYFLSQSRDTTICSIIDQANEKVSGVIRKMDEYRCHQ